MSGRHDHAHEHGHEHGGHEHSHGNGHGVHAHGGAGNEVRLRWMALLTGAFMVAEIVGGLLSGSLALLADAGHMFADFAGLVLAWLAILMARWPADSRRTFGFERVEILVAFANGVLLLAMAAMILLEAGRRAFAPIEVEGVPMLAVASAGLVVNLVVFAVLHGAEERSLNMRGAMLHVLGDLLGSVGAIVAALLILAFDWTLADPIVSALVAGLIVRSAVQLVRESAHILLEGTPPGLAIGDIAPDLAANIPHVREVHHVHAWSLTEDQPMVTLHAAVSPEANADATVRAIKTRLKSRFGIDHATVEIECGECADGPAGLMHPRRRAAG
ncbi:MAG: cation diffusion facilitator family transporter [Bauldia sp.]